MKEKSPARYEFRSFGQDLKNVHYLMTRKSDPVPDYLWRRASEEIYIVSETTDNVNLKIRDGKLQIKVLLQMHNELELWSPKFEEEFPLHAKTLAEEVFGTLKVKKPILVKSTYQINEFLELTRNNPYLLNIRVKKERHAYLVNETLCEYSVILINGARVYSVAVESDDIHRLQETIRLLSMNDLENINFIQAIKRITGLSYGKLMNEEL
jgi:hypothetical protein